MKTYADEWKWANAAPETLDKLLWRRNDQIMRDLSLGHYGKVTPVSNP